MAQERVNAKIIIENGTIIFRNFSGKESKFNRLGARNFCVIIDDPETAQQMKTEGWNIREMAPRDGDDVARYYLQVAVSYDHIPPRVFLIAGNARTELAESAIDALDYAEILNADLTIRPYNWEVSGKGGVKAYLNSMYVTIEEDPFAGKYSRDEFPDEVPL